MGKVKIGNGGIVLSGYDTEKDLRKAEADIKRMLTVLSGMSLYDIMKVLAPYRAKCAKVEQEEFDEMTEKLKNGKT